MIPYLVTFIIGLALTERERSGVSLFFSPFPPAGGAVAVTSG